MFSHRQTDGAASHEMIKKTLSSKAQTSLVNTLMLPSTCPRYRHVSVARASVSCSVKWGDQILRRTHGGINKVRRKHSGLLDFSAWFTFIILTKKLYGVISVNFSKFSLTFRSVFFRAMNHKKGSLILYLLFKALLGIFDVCSRETHLGRSLGNLPHLVCPNCSGSEVSTPPCVSSDRYWVISGVMVRAGSFLGLRVMVLPFGMWTVPGEGGQTAELRVPSFSVSTPGMPHHRSVQRTGL